MIITLKDGKQLEFDSPLSGLEITKAISEGLARAALICRVNGVLQSLNETISQDSTFEVLTWDDDELNKNNNRNFFMITTKELHKKDKEQHNFEDVYLELK